MSILEEETPCFRLDGLNRPGVVSIETPIQKVLQTIWAVTRFIYTGDNEIEFTSYNDSVISNGTVKRSVACSLEQFYVDDASIPAEISRNSTHFSNDDLQYRQLLVPDPSVPVFTRLIRQVGLYVSNRDNQISVEDYKLKLDVPHPVIMVVHVQHNRYTGFLVSKSSKHESKIADIADTVERVADMVTGHWNQPLSCVDALGQRNWHRISTSAAQTVDIGPTAVIGDILARGARTHPDKVAVEAWDGTLTYAELHQKSLHMASILMNKTIPPGSCLGICINKSKWALVAVWGVLLAGCTGVMLDTRNPRKRLEALLQSVDAKYVVTNQWKPPTCLEQGIDGVEIIHCEAESLQHFETQRSARVLPQLTPQSMAFILFTSGSTGIPKAVMIEHGPLYAGIVEIAAALHVQESSRIFQFSSFVFDASLSDIFTTALKGGCLCVPSEGERMDRLTEALAKSRCTHATLTSTVISQINAEDVPELRYLISVGEVVAKENLFRLGPHLHLMSGYGITESIIMDSFAEPEHLLADHRSIGLSRGTCLWVVSPSDTEKLQPIGAIGEILIEGPVLARGYLGQPERTAQSFITAPSWLQNFRKAHGRNYPPDDPLRCYRSGDFGIRNADGTVQYLGRADLQVKIRGQRVEIGEIENSLLVATPELDQVSVEALRLPCRDNVQTLVAFVKRPSDSKIDVGKDDESRLLPIDGASRELFSRARTKLLEYLPQYIVPSIYIPISSMPQSAAGKRDRKRLQSWGLGLSEEQLSLYQLRVLSAYRVPQTQNEKTLQIAWARVLGLPDSSVISSGDNFFQVGGDSIKAMELVGQLRRQHQSLTVSQIFQTPCMIDMALHLTALESLDKSLESPQPMTLLRDMKLPVEDVANEAASLCQVEVEDIEDIYPTMPMQEALMAISAHKPNVYTQRIVFELPESIDLNRFKRAWEMLVSEQPILRTRIVTITQAGTLQVVLKPLPVEWQEFQNIEDFLHLDKAALFTYGKPLSRYSLMRDDEHGNLYFAWSSHHAVTDGWSRPAIFEEIKHIYLAGSARPCVPYTPFISYLSAINFDEAGEFWKEQFPTTVEPFPQLPSSEYIPEANGFLSKDISLELSNSSGFTKATLIQAAWSLVTATYANSDEAVFGLILSGRDAPVEGITETLGITINAVPVRIVLDKTSSIFEFLEDVQQHISELKDHQHVGLQYIQQLSPEARSATRVQNMLVIQPVDEASAHVPLLDLGLKLVQSEERDALDHALTLKCAITDASTLRIAAHFDERVLSKGVVGCIFGFLEHVLNQLLTESTERTLHQLDMMSPYDIGLLNKINGTKPQAVEKTLHSLFEGHARATPDAIALDGFDGTLSYRELDKLSTHLSSHLTEALGVKPESRVVLCFAKSNKPIIAMLAVLKSGGTCVSINPEHPTERLHDIAREVEASVVLCDAEYRDRFKDDIPWVLSLTDTLFDDLRLNAHDDHHNVTEAHASNGSFVVFTSGSTGKPKGSLLEHRSLTTSLLATGKRVGINAETRTLQFSAYTFDCHILEIMGTLIHGGCVSVISDHQRMNELSETMRSQRVNFAVLTKTVSEMLEPADIPTLQSLILTGEVNGRQDYHRWAGHVRLFNGLGPSECTPLVCLTKEPVKVEDDPLNIGSAMGCRVWVTNNRRPDYLVPIGCVGELIVEGPIVGRGYINRPQETRSAFVHDPAWSLKIGKGDSWASRRFYKSGDLARMNPDGSITFIGRTDNQVKISGQRVELGEIENQLRHTSPIFHSSAVEALQVSSRGGATVLAAFCTIPGSHFSNGSKVLAGKQVMLQWSEEYRAELIKAQGKLSARLPLYMVPTLFIPLTQLPLNASGKLDRKQLRDLAAGVDAQTLGRYHLTARSESRAPETKAEKRLQSLWAKILDVPLNSIQAEDNFFRLGGDSVLCMKMIAAARAQGISMTVADVFRLPVLKDMALEIEIAAGAPKNVLDTTTCVRPFSLLPSVNTRVDEFIREAARDCDVTEDMIEDIYPCNPTQEALMAVSSHRATAYTYQLALKIPSFIKLSDFVDAWERLVAIHSILRTRVIFHRLGGSLQVVLRSKVDWHIAHDVSVEDYVKEEGTLSVGYGSPLCKFSIVHDESGGKTFVGILHHALYDGWSLMTLYESFYELFKEGRTISPVVSYNHFFKYLSNLDREASEDFWRRQFPVLVKGYPQLPSDSYVPRPRSHKTMSLQLNRRPNSEITLATLVQTAWAILISKYSDNEDVVFGLMSSGRDTPIDGIESITGPTIATVPLMVKISGKDKLSSLLANMQKKTSELRKYQHAGLQHIRHLSPEASAAVDFQNLLVVHTMGDSTIVSPLQKLGLEGLRMTSSQEVLDVALAVECTIQRGALDLYFSFDDKIIPDKQADFMINQMQNAITVLAQKHAETTKLEDIDLLSSYDLEHLRLWNNNISPPKDATLHGLVEIQALKTPNAIATSGFDMEYTYKELDDVSNRLAAHLTSLGIGEEQCVVLCFKRSTWPIVAICAVLKAGGVSVSLNFENPLDRRLDICHEVEATVILCDSDMVSQFLASARHVIPVNQDLFENNLLVSLSDWEKPQVSPNSAAFIVYTSGSTGKPKGVVLEHRGVALAMDTYAKTMFMDTYTRTLHFAAYSFDYHILEIFGTLVGGGCVCVVSDDERTSNLTSAINARGVNRLVLSSSVAQLIEPIEVPQVNFIVLGAEPVTQMAIEKWCMQARVMEHYSPAETSNLACANFEMGTEKDPTNIGKPCLCGVWITERNNPDRLCPVGCVGELVVEGASVGRGYFKNPAATRSAFVQNLAWSRSNTNNQQDDSVRRFYRTGDMAYFHPDGSIKFIGRADTQVKIHGHRIELREVEYQVQRALPAGSEAVVEVVNLRNIPSLVAFVTLAEFRRKSRTGELLSTDEDHPAVFQKVVDKLGLALPERLPQYMIPSTFILITYIPTSASAKVERKHLNQLAQEVSNSQMFTPGAVEVKQQPTNYVEATLQQTWARILNRKPEEVGITDLFMSLGGDSLAAMQVVSECRKAGIELNVTTILAQKTIMSIAPHCKVTTIGNQGGVEQPKTTDDNPFGLSPIQKLYFEREKQNWTRYSQGFLCRIATQFSISHWHKSLDKIVHKHAMLRSRFVKTETGWKQLTVPFAGQAVYRFNYHTGVRINNEDMINSIFRDAANSINIESGPVFSVDYLNVEDGDDMIYMIAHHLVVDLVSWRIIWQELSYGLEHGNEPEYSQSVPPLSFQSWVSLQHEMFSTMERSATEQYYPFELPATRPGYWGLRHDENTLEHSMKRSFALDADLTNMMMTISNNALNSAPLDVISGLLAYSFKEVFPDRDMATILLESHGRELIRDLEQFDISQTVGWFTTMYPVYAPISSTCTPIDAIRIVKDIRGSIPNNGHPHFASQMLSRHSIWNPEDAEVLVNFSGITQHTNSLFQPESRIKGFEQESEPKSHRQAFIEVEIEASGDTMDFAFYFHKRMAHLDQIQQWIAHYKYLLEKTLIQLSTMERRFTVSDFPNLNYSDSNLQDLLHIRLPQQGLSTRYQTLIEDIYPCSIMQEGILLSQQADGDSYKIRYIFEFKDHPLLPKDELSLSRVAQAWKLVTQRHSSLRTGVIEDATDRHHFIQITLAKLPEPRVSEIIQTILDVSELTCVPELEEGGFWAHVPRLILYRTGLGNIACVLELSHALMDGLSIELMMRDFIGFLIGQEAPSASLPLEYGRYVQYEQNLNVEKIIQYWTDYVQDANPCHLPTMEPQPSVPLSLKEYGYLSLPDDTSKGVLDACQRFGITQAALIQTAWAIVLGAISARKEVCFGYLASMRDAPLDGIEDSVGLYIGMQICRVNLKDTILNVLKTVQGDMIEGLEHRGCPLSRIQKSLGLNTTPLFNTTLTVRRTLEGDSTSVFAASEFIDVLQIPERSEYTVALNASVGPSGPQIGMSYQKSSISSEYAATIAASLHTVIQSITNSAPEVPAQQIVLLSQHDRKTLDKWNLPTPEPIWDTVHSRVEAQACATPDAIATVGFDGEYTYSQLNNLADKLAAFIHTKGMVPTVESRVVLCFTKSTVPVIAQLAVLKAGGTCASVNPDHPTRRLLDLCRDVKATSVICDSTQTSRFEGHVPQVLAVNHEMLLKLPPPQNWVRQHVRPNNAAFIIHTSGSTGKPKGAELEHSSVLTSQLVNAKVMDITSDTRTVQFASYTFDASILEIYAPLLLGGSICVISDEERMDRLAKTITERQGTWMLLMPTVAQLFMPYEAPTLKRLILGGEPIPQAAMDRWCDHIHVSNFWAPSETSNLGAINVNMTKNADPANVGHPAGTSIWITEQDNVQRLLPIGCNGEVLIEGHMVGRGYIDRPEATENAYLEDLVWAKDENGNSRRFYRTGDLGRLNANGTLMILGRSDSQVKIHGQRVELGEISHQLTLLLPLDSEVVVEVLKEPLLSKDSKPGAITIAACIYLKEFGDDNRLQSDQELQVSDGVQLENFRNLVQNIETSLSQVLPQYMVPTAFYPIRKIPTTVSTKTDRMVLKEFIREHEPIRTSHGTCSQPTNKMERDLQKIWMRVLNLSESKVSIKETFMALGGDSIAAMHAVSECLNHGIKIGVAAILRKKTIASIAPECSRITVSSNRASEPEDFLEEDGKPFNLSPIQKRFFETILPPKGGKYYNQSFFYRVKENAVNVTELRAIFDSIVNRHAMLRARYHQDENGSWRQFTLPKNTKDVYRLRYHVLSDMDEKLVKCCAENCAASIDFVKGPVFAVDFFKFANQDSMLFLTAHHLVIDIVSWEVILRELNAMIVTGNEATIPPSPLTFQEWCSRQEKEAKDVNDQGDVYPETIPSSQFDFWEVSTLDDIVGDSITESFHVPANVTDLILNQSNHAMSTSPVEILLGTLLASFSRVFTDRSVPTVFIEKHGRETIGPQELIPSQVVGWFSTMHPIHVPVNSSTSLIDAVRLVKDACHKVPGNGRPYFAYRHLNSQGTDQLSSHDPPEILLNFLGVRQQLEGNDGIIQAESRIRSDIADYNPHSRRWAMIDIVLFISEGVLQAHISLSPKMAHQSRVRQWIQAYASTLIETAQALATEQPRILTLSDFPLIDLDYHELSQIINAQLPQLGVAPSDIEDIIPLAGFQQTSIEGHLETPPRHWIWFFHNLPLEVEETRLREACVNLVRHHSLLRTIFVQHGQDKFLQVALKRWIPEMEIHIGDGNIDTLMERIFTQDINCLPSLGKPFARFILARTSSHSRLLLRLSHAQYDAFSSTIFIQDLQRLYSSQPLPAPTKFSKYVTLLNQQQPQSCDYWRTLLAGSENPTSIFSVDESLGAPAPHHPVIRLERTLPPFKLPKGVTSATVFNTACCLLIHSLTGSSDVVFGRLTGSRASLPSEMQHMIGPLANIIPVRVQFRPGYSNAEILQIVHKQYIDSIPHESINLNTIIQKCTNWSTSLAKFPIFTQHNNLLDQLTTEAQREWTVSNWDPVTVDPFPWSLGLGAFPSQSGVRLSVAANSKFTDEVTVNSILDGLCSYLDDLAQVEFV